jgi:hypothetical protein
MGEGPARMLLRATESDALEDCWTRVLRRSAGCRRKALVTPEPRPAAKWNAIDKRSVAVYSKARHYARGKAHEGNDSKLTRRRLVFLAAICHVLV